MTWLPGDRAYCLDASGSKELRQYEMYYVTAVRHLQGTPFLFILGTSGDEALAGYSHRRFQRVVAKCDMKGRHA